MSEHGSMSLPDVVPSLRAGLVNLRPFRSADVGLIVEAASDTLIPLITTVPTAPVVSEAIAYIARQHARLVGNQGYSFAIADAVTDAAVGQIGLWLKDVENGRASIGYWIVASSRGRGYAREALHRISAWGLALDGIHRLELYVEPWNEASWRAAESAGYEREGLLRSWQYVGDERRDMYMYSRLKAHT